MTERYLIVAWYGAHFERKLRLVHLLKRRLNYFLRGFQLGYMAFIKSNPNVYISIVTYTSSAMGNIISKSRVFINRELFVIPQRVLSYLADQDYDHFVW